MNVFTGIQKIIDKAWTLGLPMPTYVTVSLHASGPMVGFLFTSPHQVEQWAKANNSDPTVHPHDGHTTYKFILLGDFNVDCYCLTYDGEPE